MVSDSDHISLATGAAFGEIEVDDGPALSVAGVDIQDAFYHIELPQELRDLFTLNPIKARFLNISESVEGSVGPEDMYLQFFASVTYVLDACIVGVSAAS